MSQYNTIEGLKLQSVFRCLCDLSNIPRMSGDQQKVSNFLYRYVKSLGLICKQDKSWNVIAFKPAAKGYEDAPAVMLQAHMDMVCEKNPGVTHDFTKDPVTILRDGDKLTANGTTLGADNGIGVAYIMALLADRNAVHPRLEAVFTADEETDMGGAFGLDFKDLKSHLIINLDAQAVSVCGSGELEVEMRFKKDTVPVNPDLNCAAEISIGGLLGGHSGHKAMLERGNAVILLNRVLVELKKKVEYQITYIQGGAGMSSAFARHASCRIAFSCNDADLVYKTVDGCRKMFEKELEKRDPGVMLEISQARPEVMAFSEKTANILQNLLVVLPDGIFSLNHDFSGAMGSCSNIGALETLTDEIFATILIRSFSAVKKYYLYDKVVRICDLLGVSHRTGRDLPQWDKKLDEKTAGVLKKVYPDKEFAFWAGTLETGIFCSKSPDACIIALGCPCYNVHSPNEYFLISEAELYWEKLLEFLEQLAKQRL